MVIVRHAIFKKPILQVTLELLGDIMQTLVCVAFVQNKDSGGFW